MVARSVAALSKGPNRVLGYVENMSGYYCRDCDAIKPLFVSPGALVVLEIPCLGTVPFDPELARHCDRGIPFADLPETPVGRALEHVAQQLLDSLDHGASPMKFLCVPCDSPMKLQTVGPPERGSLSIVYSCPECGYEMAMLTNAYETQVVQSLGVRIGPDADGGGRRGRRRGQVQQRLPVHRDDARRRESVRRDAFRPATVPVRWTAAAEARLANIPEFVRPMARTGIEQFARERGALEVDETILDAARDFFGM